MAIEKKYFPSQKSSERVFLLIRMHWFVYIPLVLIGIFMILPLLIMIYYIYANLDNIDPALVYIAIIIGSAYALFVISLMLYGFIDYYLDVDIVTNERVVDIEQNGFFHRTISELYLEQVEDVSAKVNGFLPTLFNFGDVHIQTAGERANFLFKSVPRPNEIAKTIIDLHEAALEGADKQVSKMIDRMKSLPGSIADKQRELGKLNGLPENTMGMSKEVADNQADSVTPLPPNVELKLLQGIELDREKANTIGTVSFTTLKDDTDKPATNSEKLSGKPSEGELREGESIDIK